MTPQEAIKWADGKALEIICELEVTKSKERQKRLNEEYSALTTLKACAEKQVPQKVMQERITETLKPNCCPVCNHRHYEVSVPYCRFCGQALDWSDTE